MISLHSHEFKNEKNNLTLYYYYSKHLCFRQCLDFNFNSKHVELFFYVYLNFLILKIIVYKVLSEL